MLAYGAENVETGDLRQNEVEHDKAVRLRQRHLRGAQPCSMVIDCEAQVSERLREAARQCNIVLNNQHSHHLLFFGRGSLNLPARHHDRTVTGVLG